MSLWLTHSTSSAWVTPHTCHLWVLQLHSRRGSSAASKPLENGDCPPTALAPRQDMVRGWGRGGEAMNCPGCRGEQQGSWEPLSWCGDLTIPVQRPRIWGCGTATPVCQVHQEPTLMMNATRGAQLQAQYGLGTKSTW